MDVWLGWGSGTRLGSAGIAWVTGTAGEPLPASAGGPGSGLCVSRRGSGVLFPKDGGGKAPHPAPRTVHLPCWSLLQAQAGVSFSLRLAAKVKESPSGLEPGRCPPSALRFPSTTLSPSISPSDSTTAFLLAP